jgi:hypothetical protein
MPRRGSACCGRCSTRCGERSDARRVQREKPQVSRDLLCALTRRARGDVSYKPRSDCAASCTAKSGCATSYFGKRRGTQNTKRRPRAAHKERERALDYKAPRFVAASVRATGNLRGDCTQGQRNSCTTRPLYTLHLSCYYIPYRIRCKNLQPSPSAPDCRKRGSTTWVAKGFVVKGIIARKRIHTTRT